MPKRVVKIGYKIYAGIPLEIEERKYLKRWQKTYPSVFYWSQRQNHLDEPLLFIDEDEKAGTESPFMQDADDERVLGLLRKKPRGRPFTPLFIADDERILKLLPKHPQGMTRSDLSSYLHVPAVELALYLNQLIQRQQVIAVRRENTCGRPLTPLFFIAGAEIPEMQMVNTERNDRIRHAHFIEGWSIKRIIRELHHDKRTIRRALKAGRSEERR